MGTARAMGREPRATFPTHPPTDLVHLTTAYQQHCRRGVATVLLRAPGAPAVHRAGIQRHRRLVHDLLQCAADPAAVVGCCADVDLALHGEESRAILLNPVGSAAGCPIVIRLRLAGIGLTGIPIIPTRRRRPLHPLRCCLLNGQRLC